jgi:hypothetical protein
MATENIMGGGDGETLVIGALDGVIDYGVGALATHEGETFYNGFAPVRVMAVIPRDLNPFDTARDIRRMVGMLTKVADELEALGGGRAS